MITKGLFYFGKRGTIQPLLSVQKGSNPEATPIAYGSIFQGINGHVTRDVYGVRRKWVFKWAWTSEGDHAYLEAAYRGHIQGPFFLMDTRTTNLLSADVSLGGSETHSAANFAVDNGTMEWFNHSIAFPLADLATTVGGCIDWDTNSSGGTLRSLTEIPYISGSSYVFSCYVYPSGSHNITPKFGMITPAGALAGYGSAAPISVTSGSWQRISCTVPAASLGGVSFSPALEWLFSDDLKTTGWQVSYDTALSPWRLGTGCVEVAVADFARSYPHPRHEEISASVWEV